MTIIKITNNRAIVVHDTSFALAKWSQKQDKNKKKYYDWTEYCWPSTMERAVDKLAQTLISQLNIEVSLFEFRAKWVEFVEQIKAKLDEEGR
jgi:hypothetical protein